MRLLLAATLLLIRAVFCPSFAESGTAPATHNPASIPAWQTFKLGAGGFVTDILIYPDGTEIATTDTYGFYLWNGTIWNQLLAEDHPYFCSKASAPVTTVTSSPLHQKDRGRAALIERK
jgi:hypothetical protein